MLFVALAMNVGPDAGWFAYVPLSGPQFSPGHRVDFWSHMITLTEISALVGAVEIITTVFKQRAPGDVAQPHSALRLGASRHVVHDHFCDARRHARERRAGDGSADARQHAFLQRGGRRRCAALSASVLVFRPSGGLHHFHSGNGFCFDHHRNFFAPQNVWLSRHGAFADRHRRSSALDLWVHHMFATPLPKLGQAFFTGASMLIAIPSGIQIFCWIATLLSGKPHLKTAAALGARLHRRVSCSAA